MHQIIYAKATKICEIAKEIYKITLYAPQAVKNAAPGKFINVYPRGKDMLLPRPLCISEIHPDGLTLVFGAVGKGTKELASAKVGDIIRISSPMGNGFDIGAMDVLGSEKKEKRVFIFGGGVGTPPMVELAKALARAGYMNVFAVIGFKQEPFLERELEKAGARVWTALESKGQNVLDKFIQADEKESGKADYAFACGPRPMLKALALYFKDKKVPLQVSVEERMGCGYGACVGCVCKTTAGYKKVCCDGPVFMADEIIWD